MTLHLLLASLAMATACWIGLAPTSSAGAALASQETAPAETPAEIPPTLPKGLEDYFGRPEACVLVRVSLPPGERAPSSKEPNVYVAAVDLGMDYTYPTEIDQATKPWVDGSMELVMRVPVSGRLGFAAYSPSRGYTEVVVAGGTWEQGRRVPAEGDALPKIDLVLLPVAETSKVQVVPDCRLQPESYAPVRYNAKLPLTGLTIETRDFEQAESAEPFAFHLPPGLYRIEGSPYFRACGNGCAMPDPAAALSTPVECPAPRPLTLVHRIEEGCSLRFDIDVEGAPPSAMKFLKPGEGQRRSTWWFDATHDPADRWYAEVTIESLDASDHQPTGRLAAQPTRVAWGWFTQLSASARTRVPLGQHAYTTDVYPPGRYRLRFEGPLIEPKTIDVTITPEELSREDTHRRTTRKITLRARH